MIDNETPGTRHTNMMQSEPHGRSDQSAQGIEGGSAPTGLSAAREIELRICLADVSIKTAVLGMFWFRPDRTFFRVNQASYAMSGYSEAELLQMSVAELTGTYPGQAWRARWRELTEKKALSYVSHQVHKDGHLVPVEIDVSHVFFEGGEFGVDFARDLTVDEESERERDDLRAQLLHLQKMESVGVLAGGIAHNFNNLLTAIMGNIELAMLRFTPGDEVHTLLSAATTASVRARDVTRQVLTFASGGGTRHVG
jgi:PAS domain S-box-containing protein